MGSTGSLDNIEEDYNRSAAARATGYLGKNSEVVWMQRLNRWADEPSGGEGSPQKSDESAEYKKARPTMESGLGGNEQHPTSGSTYHCDDLPVIVSEQVDPFELPPKQVADRFFQSYLDVGFFLHKLVLLFVSTSIRDVSQEQFRLEQPKNSASQRLPIRDANSKIIDRLFIPHFQSLENRLSSINTRLLPIGRLSILAIIGAPY